jgi:hypothetical protein
VEFFSEASEAPYYDSCTAPGNTHFPEFFPDTRQVSNLAIGIGSAASRVAVATSAVSAPVLRTVRRGAQRARPIWTVS